MNTDRPTVAVIRADGVERLHPNVPNANIREAIIFEMSQQFGLSGLRILHQDVGKQPESLLLPPEHFTSLWKPGTAREVPHTHRVQQWLSSFQALCPPSHHAKYQCPRQQYVK